MTGHTSVAVGRRVRELRTERGITLSELARRAAIGKATLSEIESGRRNPTIETLYALCTPLQIPMTGLIGDGRTIATTAQGERSGGGMTSTTLDVRHLAGQTVEVFRLEFAVGAHHRSPAHPRGVTEHLTVVSGVLAVGPDDDEITVAAGSSGTFDADRPHGYRCVGEMNVEAVLVMVTPDRT